MQLLCSAALVLGVIVSVVGVQGNEITLNSATTFFIFKDTKTCADAQTRALNSTDCVVIGQCGNRNRFSLGGSNPCHTNASDIFDVGSPSILFFASPYSMNFGLDYSGSGQIELRMVYVNSYSPVCKWTFANQNDLLAFSKQASGSCQAQYDQRALTATVSIPTGYIGCDMLWPPTPYQSFSA